MSREFNRKYNSEEYIRGLLEKYKELPCLWKVKSKCLSNRNMREDAYKELMKYTQDTIDPNATVDIIKKKIGTLKRTFRRELVKVKESKKSGAGEEDIYIPQLWWYYNLLLFTSDQEEPRESISNDDPLEKVEKEEAMFNDLSEDNNELQATQQPQAPISPIRTYPSTQPTKKGKVTPKDSNKLLAKAYETLERSAPATDEHDNFGVIVAAKLRKMDDDQRTYCEYIINTALPYETLKKLQENSFINLSSVNQSLNTTPFSEYPSSNSEYLYTHLPGTYYTTL